MRATASTAGTGQTTADDRPKRTYAQEEAFIKRQSGSSCVYDIAMGFVPNMNVCCCWWYHLATLCDSVTSTSHL